MKNVKTQNRITWVIVLLLLGLLLYGIFRKPETEEQRTMRVETIRRESYERAVKCSETDSVRVAYEDIDWVTTPGSELVYEAVDGTARLAGWADPSTNTIYIPKVNETKRWIATHEVLHLLGYLGHPDHPFKTCRVMPDQN